jgi:hypothetical protein
MHDAKFFGSFRHFTLGHSTLKVSNGKYARCWAILNSLLLPLENDERNHAVRCTAFHTRPDCERN